MKRIVVLLLAGTLVGACGSGAASSASKPSRHPRSADPATATRPRSTVAPTTTAPRPAPTTSPLTAPPVGRRRDTTPPPPLLAVGTNYPAIARSLITYSDWIFGHRPDPALANTVFQPGTVTYGTVVHLLTTQQKRHWTVVSLAKTMAFTAVTVQPYLVTLRERETLVEDRTFDGAHRLIKTTPYPVPNHFVITMTSDGSRWRIADFTQVELDPVTILPR